MQCPARSLVSCVTHLLHNRRTRGKNKEIFNRDLRNTLVTFFEMIKFNAPEDDVVAPRSVSDSAVCVGQHCYGLLACMVHGVTDQLSLGVLF